MRGDLATRIKQRIEGFDAKSNLPDTDRYFGPDWRALFTLFAMLRFDTADDVWAGTLAVFGWMPTMLGKVREVDALITLVQELRSQCGTYDPSRSDFDPALGARCLEIIQSVNCRTLSAFMPAGGQSANQESKTLVGMSKFLHFVVPHVLPIWDRNVARALNKTGWFRKREHYVEYVKACYAALPGEIRAIEPVRMRLDADTNLSVPDLRVLEFTLFLIGRTGPKKFDSPPQRRAICAPT